MHYVNLHSIINLFMWNLRPVSKLTEDRIRQRSYEKHLEKLREMKPQIKIKCPEQPVFVYTKPKQEMSRRDRLIEIDYQNELLLEKMQGIKDAKYKENKLRPEAQQLKTLNQHVMNLQAEEIFHENKRICKKLMDVNSFYPTFTIMNKTDALEKVRINISTNARRAKSVTNLHTRPQSSLTYRSSRFYRSKVNKFDNEGNTSEERVYKLYQVPSEADLRPESAPTFKKASMRPYSSERPLRRPGKTQGQNDENIEQTDCYGGKAGNFY